MRDYCTSVALDSGGAITMSPTYNEVLLKTLRADRAHIRALEAQDKALALFTNAAGVTLAHGDIVALSTTVDESVLICAGPIPDIASGGALGDHDHSGDVGDGGQFDVANLTSGAATDGQVPMADGLGGVAWEDILAGLLEGADIDMSVVHTVARAGNVVLLFSGAGNLLAEYACTGVGLVAALAAAAAGDVVELPACTIVGDATVPAGVSLRGLSYIGSIILGTVTLGASSILENLCVASLGDQVGALYGVVSGATGEAALKNVLVICQNVTGPAYAVYLAAGGDVVAYETELLAEVGTEGYAAYIVAGTFTQYSGRAVGTVATYPYYI